MKHRFIIVSMLLVSVKLACAATPATLPPLPGMPTVHDTNNIYSDANANMFSSTVRQALHRVYVPNSLDNTVSVIDSATYKVVDTFKVGKLPQHVVPAYDLKTLWVLNNHGNSITPIDPLTGKPGTAIHMEDPYNLYFTPDGRFAIGVSEEYKRLDFYDSKTMKLKNTVPVNCRGVNHIDFTADGRYAVATCEFSGELLKLDVANQKVLGYLSLSTPMTSATAHELEIHPDGSISIAGQGQAHGSMPQDVRLSPDGSVFYVADMMMNGVVLIDPVLFKKVGFIPTGIGTHSVYPSRDGKFLYVANRGCSTMECHKHPPGNVAVIDPTLQKVVAVWAIPGGGSPDMGNVSADGKEFWLSGRFDNEVYVFDTTRGVLAHRIPVGDGPHGLTVWPQPGRYSLGHTGNMR